MLNYFRMKTIYANIVLMVFSRESVTKNSNYKYVLPAGKCSKFKAREEFRLFVMRGKFIVIIRQPNAQMAKKCKPKKESYIGTCSCFGYKTQNTFKFLL